ncbi:MAG: triose-phosphate isomerase [Candidatus Harrisonbacteria bacterium]|nr:triose-phosphate isomerase [Candidatus Harrisonbacteria bacterium]
MTKLLILNWKMNPATLKEALSLAKASDYKNVVVAPPFPFLEEVGKVLKKSRLGAQDLFYEEKGAFTGEVSAKELKSVRVKYVIIGHSERRHKFDETDEMVAKKMKAAAENKLIPVLCVGETIEEKNAGKKEAVIERQLKIGLFLYPRPYTLNPFIVAYEPVWAIGTGNPETPESALETIKYIRKILNAKPYTLNPKILYGGSVDSRNLRDYLKYKEVDGALVGGASLKKEEVKKMISYV